MSERGRGSTLLLLAAAAIAAGSLAAIEALRRWRVAEQEATRVTLARAQSDLDAVANALEEYCQRHQQTPRSLRSLPIAPQRLTDPFSRDADYRLRRADAGLVVYSIGPDGTDDHGEVALSMERLEWDAFGRCTSQGDLVVRAPFCSDP